MITSADLKTQSRRNLADFAKQLGLSGFQSMRKEELVDAIRKAQRAVKKSPPKKAPAPAKTKALQGKSETGATSKNSKTKTSGGKSSAKIESVGKAKAPRETAGTKSKTKSVPTETKVKKPVRPESPGSKNVAAVGSTTGKKTTKTRDAELPKTSGGKTTPSSGRSSTRQSAVAAGKERTRTSALTPTPQPKTKRASQPSKSPASDREAVKAKKAAEKPQRPPTAPKIVKVLRKQQADAESRKDLSVCVRVNEHTGTEMPSLSPRSDRTDRVVLIVRDSYWLQVCWEIARPSVERARAAMASEWHAAVPVIRLMEVGHGSAINSAETMVRDIPIHGGVNHWYIDVDNPPARYRVLIGYRASTGRFYTLCRSNIVQTPAPGACDPIEGHWQEIAEDYERIYSLSEDENGTGSNDLREMFEERLQRPMPDLTGETLLGNGSGELGIRREKDLPFEVDAELIIFGSTTPGTTVMLSGKPVRLTADGSFTVRMELPDRRQVIPVVASSRDGMRQRTTVVAVERNTKVMEPVSRNNLE